MYLPAVDPDLQISPGLQIRVWNLPDNRQSLPILVEWTSWQWNFFEYFALFQLFTVNIEHSLTNSGMPLHNKQYCDWWEGNQLAQMLQFPQHLFSAFFSQMTSCALCIMTLFFIIPSPSILNICSRGGLTALYTWPVFDCCKTIMVSQNRWNMMV